jgi:Flp pilus assembly protein TadG
MMKAISAMWLRGKQKAIGMFADCRGIAATEFAVIVPIMLVLFFGTVEFSSAVAVNRKVTLIARALSDLPAQTPPPSLNSTSATMTDVYLQNVFSSSIAIMSPYPPSLVQATISEIYVDSTGRTAKIVWSKSGVIANDAATQATLTTSTLHTPNQDVTNLLPSNLLVPKTYLIYSEVSYLYTPTIGYVLKAAVNLQDKAFTRPRQAYCIIYNNAPTDPCPTT